MISFKDWISDQLQFDIEFRHNWFLAFDFFYWQLGIFHGPSSLEVVIGPFSLTKQYSYDPS